MIADGNGACSTEPAIAGFHKLTDVSGFNNQFPHAVGLVVGDQEVATIGGKHGLNWMLQAVGGCQFAADVSASDGIVDGDPGALAVTHVQQPIGPEREAAH